MRSREIAMGYSGWESEAEKQRFFDNLVIKVGGIKGVPYGIYVYICYKDMPLEAEQFADVPFFEKTDDGNLIITRFRAKSVPIDPGMRPQSGIAIRTSFSREINNFIPETKINRYIGILHREWGAEIPVQNRERYSIIRHRERDERAENNRIIFSALIQSTGLSQKTASELLNIREDSLRKMLDGKGSVSDALVERCEKLEWEIQHYADIISNRIRESDSDEVNITISETKYGHDIALAYNIDAPCRFNINGKDEIISYNTKEGIWSIPVFRSILGRVIGSTNRKINIKEVPWTEQK